MFTRAGQRGAGRAGHEGPAGGVSTPGSETNTVVQRWARAGGLHDDDITYLNAGTGAERLAMLEGGTVDVVAITPEVAPVASKRGFVLVADLTEERLAWQRDALTLPENMVNGDPTLAAAIVRAVSEAAYLIRSDRQRFDTIVSKYVKLDDPEALAAAYRTSMRGWSPRGRLDPANVQAVLESLQKTISRCRPGAAEPLLRSDNPRRVGARWASSTAGAAVSITRGHLSGKPSSLESDGADVGATAGQPGNVPLLYDFGDLEHDLVGEGDAQGLRGLQVDGDVERWAVHREIGRVGPLQDLVHVVWRSAGTGPTRFTPMTLGLRFHELLVLHHRRQPVLERQVRESFLPGSWSGDPPGAISAPACCRSPSRTRPRSLPGRAPPGAAAPGPGCGPPSQLLRIGPWRRLGGFQKTATRARPGCSP